MAEGTLTAPSGTVYTVKDPKLITMRQARRIRVGDAKATLIARRFADVERRLNAGAPKDETPEQRTARLAAMDEAERAAIDTEALRIAAEFTDQDAEDTEAYSAALITAYLGVEDPSDTLGREDYEWLANELHKIDQAALPDFSDKAKVEDPKAQPDGSSS